MPASRLAILSLALPLAALLGGCDAADDACSDPGPPCATCVRTEGVDGCASYVCPAECFAASPDAATGDTPPGDADGRSDTGGAVDGGRDTGSTIPDTGGSGSVSYRFVRIDDVGEVTDAVDAGADLDAVILEKADGSVRFAAGVEVFTHGLGREAELNPNEVLGPPDAFSDWEGPDPVCDLGQGYVSLGGFGGTLILDMAADIEQGDTLSVLELGGCTGNDGPEGIPDAIEVSVSVGGDLDGSWVYVTSGEGPVISAPVPTLP